VKVVGYLRVSTERQADEGLGLDVQERAIRSWARANGHRVALCARDEGVSGAKELEHRQGLADALEAIRGRQAGGVVVYRLDRLARDLVLQEQLLAELWRIGASVFSTSAGEAAFLVDDPADPSRRLIRQVLGAVAEYERSMIALRLAAGRRRKAELGGYAYGSPPYGFRAEGRQLAPDPDEHPALERIAELRAGGASLREVARVLTAEGYRPKRGERWHPEVLRHIVERLPVSR